jgi:hypothetical protein
MKMIQKLFVSALAIGVLAFGVSTNASEDLLVAEAPMQKSPSLTVQPDLRSPTGTKVMKPDLGKCPDPAVTSLEAMIVSRKTPFSGQVKITAEVKNLGTVAYESAKGQQSIQLYESPMGGRAKLVKQRGFLNLGPGETLKLSYTRAWNASSPNEGEFPPNYYAIISYDPDIRMDGNTRNDDCNLNNNRKEFNGSEINTMFR